MKKSISPATAVIAILVVVVVVVAVGYLTMGKGKGDTPGADDEPDVLDEGGTPMLAPSTSGAANEGTSPEMIEPGMTQ